MFAGASRLSHHHSSSFIFSFAPFPTTPLAALFHFFVDRGNNGQRPSPTAPRLVVIREAAPDGSTDAVADQQEVSGRVGLRPTRWAVRQLPLGAVRELQLRHAASALLLYIMREGHIPASRGPG